MAVMAEELVPVLEDARQAHTAVLDRFRADAAVTPPGAYRQMLERQATEVQVSLQRIQHRVRDLRPRGILDTAAGVTRFVSHGAVRTVMLPLTITTGIVRDMLPGGGPADARQLLRNAEDEYAAAARALAACRAGEVLAEQVDDEDTAELLGALRRQDEELLQALEDSLAEQARAVVASTNGSGPRGNHHGGVADTAGRTMRTVVDRARHVARSGVRRASGADTTRTVRGVPEPGPMAEEVLGAVRREEDLPIPGFSQLSTEQIQRRLPSLSQLDLTVIEGYEHAHARRKRVLDAIEKLRGAEPWTGYDAMHADDVVASLQDAPSDQARQALEYEQRHRRRQKVISAAQTRVSG
ncbi:hypothetical protein ACFYO2_24840 [Streptomyces sp. NPDC006602]|uniref:hypothetical protein n=1 Tax=Streptomyces sp. NPDC006602 TaxID=3364751 RepID=UPI00367606E3